MDLVRDILETYLHRNTTPFLGLLSNKSIKKRRNISIIISRWDSNVFKLPLVVIN